MSRESSRKGSRGSEPAIASRTLLHTSTWSAGQGRIETPAGPAITPGGAPLTSSSGFRFGLSGRRVAPTQNFPPVREALGGNDLLLWKAAKEGHEEQAGKMLRELANVDCEMPDDQEGSVTYKGRKITCQPIHAAATLILKCSTDACEEGTRRADRKLQRVRTGASVSSSDELMDSYKSDQQRGKAARLVSLLVEHRADVNSHARTGIGGELRKMQPIHLASGSGNVGVLKILLENGADPNAKALIGDDVHYYPIHDAAFLNRVGAVKCLLENKAAVDNVNNHGMTALHIAAELGYFNVVETLLEHAKTLEGGAQSLLTQEDNEGELALTKAITKGLFPASKLHLFTQDLDPEERVKAFCLVASRCPSSTSSLLWDGQRSEDEFVQSFGRAAHNNIDVEWRKSLIEGASGPRPQITVNTLVNLIDVGPEAAMYLLEALTGRPKVTDPQHNPLPVRAHLPRGSEPVQMSCAYKRDCSWKWDAVTRIPKWHSKLVKHDVRNGVEVATQVVKLKGIINKELLFALAVTTDRRIFTKLAVHALLKHAWSQLRWIFILESLHELVATLILSVWILSGELQPEFRVRFTIWCWTASRGIAECILVCCMATRVTLEFGRKKAWDWLVLQLFRLLTGACTALLCFKLLPDFWPSKDNKIQSILLVLNSLLHWTFLLHQLRAFPVTGQKLLPIIKSVKTIAPMLLIVFFLMMAFVHGFWAFDMSQDADVRFFEVASLLFTGENLFVSREDLAPMGQDERWLYILFTLGGVFLFLACALNVFIAVLGDCYDWERERMSCSFLQERARICCSSCLGISFSKFTIASRLLMLAAFLVPFSLVALGEILTITAFTRLGPWIVASGFALLVLLVNGGLQFFQSRSWGERYIWLCHKITADETINMVDECDDGVEHPGRMMRIKKHLHNRVTELEKKVDDLKVQQSTMQSSIETKQDALLRSFEKLMAELYDLQGLRTQVSGMREEQVASIKKVSDRLENVVEVQELTRQSVQKTQQDVEKISEVMRVAAGRRNHGNRGGTAASSHELRRALPAPPERGGELTMRAPIEGARSPAALPDVAADVRELS